MINKPYCREMLRATATRPITFKPYLEQKSLIWSFFVPNLKFWADPTTNLYPI